MAHSRGFYRPRGPPPRFPPSQGRPPPPLMRSPSPRFVGQPKAPFSSDFVIGGGPLQDVKPPRRAPVAGARHNTPLKKPAHLCVGFDASQRFPNAKERLHNVLQGAMKGNSMRFDSREVGDKWQATVNIPWPREMSFYGEGSSKKEAEKNVAAIACVELERLGVANISSAMIIKKEAVQSKDEPKWIYIDDDRLTKVESFLLKNSVLSQQLYRNQNQPLVQPQPFPKDQRSSAIKPNNSESGKQAEASNVNEDDRKDAKAPEFWKDSDVRDADFSNWETPSAEKTSQLKDSQSKTSSLASTDVTVNSKKVKDIFSGSPWKALSPEQLANHNEQLLGEYKQRQVMVESRNSWFSEETKKLPVANYREKIVDLIGANKVVVLSGETGCGKTTQIPQFILDHAIKDGKGASCNIVVTQPRRIVAMSIAERVAWERGEVLGKSVGYQVRLEGKPPTQYGRILFCTTGILLRRMQNNTLLQGVSHVIVDEVHERDINTDFLLILLKELLDENQLLKVIVMSATVNSERFSQYFQGCPSLNIPGFTHSVTEYFLPDVHKMLGCRGMSSMPCPPQSKRFKPNNSSAKVQNDIESPKADAELISEVILHVCRNYQEGAILCFLSGWDEISLVHDILASKISDAYKSQFLVLPLHSMLPMFNQRTVFERPAVGVRKIVLATNIAETSITIDDVVYVINAGNEKEQMYDAANKVSCLVTNWTSQASVVQRRGRAGRCKPGFCFNLFSKEQFQNMSPYQSAEMQRISLEEIVLQTKIQCSDPSCKVQEFLSKALDPPSPTNVQSAISELQEIGALDNQEDLTALGKYLAYLPVEPRIAKMIIYGAIFRCLDPILTIAAGLSYKEPFVTPLNCRLQADQSRKAFTHGSKSDHVALLNAYNGWTEALNHARAREFVEQRFLHWGTLNMISGMRDQLSRLLEMSGLITSFHIGHTINAFSKNLELVKAIVCAGLFPNAVKMGLGIESKGKCGKKRVRLAFRTRSDGRVAIHPSSVNSDEKQFASQWLVYHDKVKSTQIFIRDSSMVHPVALILLSGKDVKQIRHEIRHGPAPSPHEPRVTLAVDGDRWMAFHCSPRLARVLQAIREEIKQMVSSSISPASTNNALFHHHTKLIEVISLLLTLPIQESYPNLG